MNIKPKIISTEFLISPQNLCSAIFPISENRSPFFQLLISKTLKVPWLVSFSHTSHLIKSTAKLWWTYFQAVWLSLISSTAATLVQATIASLLELLQLLLRRFKCFHHFEEEVSLASFYRWRNLAKDRATIWNYRGPGITTSCLIPSLKSTYEVDILKMRKLRLSDTNDPRPYM